SRSTIFTCFLRGTRVSHRLTGAVRFLHDSAQVASYNPRDERLGAHVQHLGRGVEGLPRRRVELDDVALGPGHHGDLFAADASLLRQQAGLDEPAQRVGGVLLVVTLHRLDARAQAGGDDEAVLRDSPRRRWSWHGNGPLREKTPTAL